jgi:hypothetical protein
LCRFLLLQCSGVTGHAARIQRTWLKVIRSQTTCLESFPPLSPSRDPCATEKTVTRAERAHWRLSWQQRLARNGREFDLYYDRRDISVLYIFVEGTYVGEAYCPAFMGGRVSEWEARAMRQHSEEQARIAREQGLPVRARIQDAAKASRRRRSTEIRASEQARQWDRQRGDIHPALVSERLASVQAEITQVVTLADPVPDAELDRPVPLLPIRMMQEE